MRFFFNERKSAQAAAHLLARHEGSLDYGCLIKLLYLADRTALIEHGLPITGDDMWMMKHGPVLESVKDCMNGRGDAWRDLISTRDDDNRVFLKSPCVDCHPPAGELSEFELEILDDVDDEFGHMGWDGIVEFCHTLPEWEPIEKGRRPLLPERILWAAGVPQERIRQIRKQAELLASVVEAGGSGL